MENLPAANEMIEILKNELNQVKEENAELNKEVTALKELLIRK